MWRHVLFTPIYSHYLSLLSYYLLYIIVIEKNSMLVGCGLIGEFYYTTNRGRGGSSLDHCDHLFKKPFIFHREQREPTDDLFPLAVHWFIYFIYSPRPRLLRLLLRPHPPYLIPYHNSEINHSVRIPSIAIPRFRSTSIRQPKPEYSYI